MREMHNTLGLQKKFNFEKCDIKSNQIDNKKNKNNNFTIIK